ncbi:FtsB family cell division protein [Lactiplantibacillus plantarum]
MTNGSRNKIKQLDNDYIRQVATDEHGQAQRVAQVRRRRFILIVAVFGALILFFGFQLINTRSNLHQVNRQVATSQVKLKKVQQKNNQLESQIKQLNNKDYLQKLLRSKYDYIRRVAKRSTAYQMIMLPM